MTSVITANQGGLAAAAAGASTSAQQPATAGFLTIGDFHIWRRGDTMHRNGRAAAGPLSLPVLGPATLGEG